MTMAATQCHELISCPHFAKLYMEECESCKQSASRWQGKVKVIRPPPLPGSLESTRVQFIRASGLISWQQSADRSAGGRTRSWSWAPPCCSAGGRPESTRWQRGQLPSDLQHLSLQRPRKKPVTIHQLIICRVLFFFFLKTVTYQLWGRCAAPWGVWPAVDLAWGLRGGPAQAEDRGSGTLSTSRRCSSQNSGRAPEEAEMKVKKKKCSNIWLWYGIAFELCTEKASLTTRYNIIKPQSEDIYLWGVKDVFDLHEVGDVPGVPGDGAERKPVIPHKGWQDKQGLNYIGPNFLR